MKSAGVAHGLNQGESHPLPLAVLAFSAPWGASERQSSQPRYNSKQATVPRPAPSRGDIQDLLEISMDGLATTVI